MCARSVWCLAIWALCTACGMAERDDRDHKSYEYLTFSDDNFKAYCLQEFDTNQDGRFSRYEAESVRSVVCPSRGITSLTPIESFVNLQHIDCSDNELELLSLDQNTELLSVNCSNNRLTELSLDHLRRLAELTCHNNRLSHLRLDYTQSLRRLDCRFNLLSTLDLSACSTLLQADTRSNPDLTTIYCRAGQQVNYDAPSVVVVR